MSTSTNSGSPAAPLHIAYLLTTNLDGPLGSGRIGPLARALVRRGHKVEIYVLDPNQNAANLSAFEWNGVHVCYVAPMHVRKNGDHKTYYKPVDLIRIAALATWRLTRSALQTDANILHVCKPHPMNSIAGLGGKWLRKKTLFIDCDDYEAAANMFSAGWQKTIVAAFERQIPRRAVAVTTNSRFMMNKLKLWGTSPEKIGYLPNGVDRSRFQSPDPSLVQSLRSRLRLNGKNVVAYIGSLSLVSHPVILLFEALAQARLALPNLALLIVGGGEDIATLKNLAAQKGLAQDIVFTGRIPPDEVVAYYHLAGVTVDPVNDDDVARARSPLKMFESWACGVPFITSDVGDRSALMGAPPAGILTQPGNPTALAEAILKLFSEPQLAEDVRVRGLERVKSYDWDALADSLEIFYRSFL